MAFALTKTLLLACCSSARPPVDGCYSSKFLRSSTRRFLLEARGTISSARRASPLTMVKTAGGGLFVKQARHAVRVDTWL